MKVYENIHEAYLGTLADVYDNPEYIASPRGQRTREKLDYSFKILKPTVEPIITKDLERNEVIKRYTEKEFQLYDSCTNRVEDFEKASKFWKKIANPDGTVNSAYGYLIWRNKSHGNPKYEDNRVRPNGDEGPMRTPWDWATEALTRDRDTRQAILRFSLPEHFWMGNQDQTCTLHGNFLIRENKLNLTITMRSNDLTLGLVYDLSWFISLLHRMHTKLHSTYPDLEIGTYTHFVHSLHIYDRDEEKILKMLGRK